MKNAIRAIILIIFSMLVGCKKEIPTEQKQIIDGGALGIPIVYMNSFESAQDTVGWQGIFQYMFVNDPAPNCGSKSLKIGGGCIFPTASIDFDSTLSEHSYKISCWAKVGENGGMIFLTTDDEKSFSPAMKIIEITDTVWTHYETDSTFYCPANKKLRLGIFSGGYIPGHIYVDLLSIIQID